MSEGPHERPCPYCQTPNVAIARRCRMCLSELPPVAGVPATGVAWAAMPTEPLPAPQAYPPQPPAPAGYAPFVQETLVPAPAPAGYAQAPVAAPAPSFTIGAGAPQPPAPRQAPEAFYGVDPHARAVGAAPEPPVAAQRCGRCGALNAPSAQRCHECRAPLASGTAAAIDQAMRAAAAAMRPEPAAEPAPTAAQARRRPAAQTPSAARSARAGSLLALLPILVRLLSVLWLAYSLQDVNGWLKNITRDLGPAEPAALNYTLHALYETVWSVAAVLAIWLVTFVRGRRPS